MAGLMLENNPMMIGQNQPQNNAASMVRQANFNPKGRRVGLQQYYRDMAAGGSGTGGISPQASQPSFNNVGDVTSAIHRHQWGDYMKRFRPFEDELINSVGDHSGTIRNVASDVASQFDTAQSENNRMMQGYGLQIDPQQRASSERQNELQKMAAKTGAINTTRRHLRDRDMATLAGGL